MTEPKFHNANGDLSMYALNCGYIQKTLTGPEVNAGNELPFGSDEPIMLPRYEVALSGSGASWDVKVSDHRLSYGLAAWEQFDTLTSARKAYRRAVAYYSREDVGTAEAIVRDNTPEAVTPAWAMI